MVSMTVELRNVPGAEAATGRARAHTLVVDGTQPIGVIGKAKSICMVASSLRAEMAGSMEAGLTYFSSSACAAFSSARLELP